MHSLPLIVVQRFLFCRLKRGIFFIRRKTNVYYSVVSPTIEWGADSPQPSGNRITANQPL